MVVTLFDNQHLTRSRFMEQEVSAPRIGYGFKQLRVMFLFVNTVFTQFSKTFAQGWVYSYSLWQPCFRLCIILFHVLITKNSLILIGNPLSVDKLLLLSYAKSSRKNKRWLTENKCFRQTPTVIAVFCHWHIHDLTQAHQLKGEAQRDHSRWP